MVRKWWRSEVWWRVEGEWRLRREVGRVNWWMLI
jgi:hypothetical protein